MAKLKTIKITVENIALGDVLDKLDGMPGIVNIDLSLRSEKALVADEGTKNGTRRPNSPVAGITLQDAVLKLLSVKGPQHIKEIKAYLGGENHRAYGAVHSLRVKGSVEGKDSIYRLSALGRKQMPVELQATPTLALPKPHKANGSKPLKPARGEGRNILLTALSAGPAKREALAKFLEAGGLSQKSISGRLIACRNEGLAKTNGQGMYELTAKGTKAAATLLQHQTEAAALQQGA